MKNFKYILISLILITVISVKNSRYIQYQKDVYNIRKKIKTNRNRIEKLHRAEKLLNIKVEKDIDEALIQEHYLYEQLNFIVDAYKEEEKWDFTNLEKLLGKLLIKIKNS